MKNLFFIKGNEERPELVLAALIAKYPELANSVSNAKSFKDEKCYYYVNGEGRCESCTTHSFMYKFLLAYGEEVVLDIPKKIKFKTKIMYQPVRVSKTTGDYDAGSDLYDTVEELLEKESPICHKNYVMGYTEFVLKVPVEE